MRRKIMYVLAASLILVLLFLSGAAVWILGTSAGARWLMREVSSYTSLTVEAREVEGRIWGDFRLGRLTVRWSEGRLTAGSFHIRWNPLRLIYGEVAVRDVVLNKVHLQDDRPETPGAPEIVWPHVTGLLSRIDVNVDSFGIQGLSYRRLEEDPVMLDNIAGRLAWRNGLLAVGNLAVDSPMGKTEGTLSAGFMMPSLSLNLAVRPATPVVGLDRISINTKLRARHLSGPLKGDLHLAGNSGRTLSVELKSGLEVDRHSVRLVDFQVARITRGGSITGNGDVAFSERGPRFHLSVKTAGLDLSPFLGTKTDLSARVVLAGTFGDYNGHLELANKGDSLRSIDLDGSLRGDSEGIRIESVEGFWLGGTVNGIFSAGWKQNISLLASLQMRDLNPSLISSEWTGQINADANASVSFPENKPVSASFSAKLLKSSLRGKVLTGEVKAGLAGNNLLIDRLLLRGKGFNVTASGELPKRIDFAADISDLSGLLPGTRGALHAAGWAGRADGLLTGNIEGRARKIAAGDLRIAAADFRGHSSGSKGYPFQLATAVNGLVYDGIEVTSADLRAGGVLADHVIDLGIKARGATIVMKLSGGYEGERWLGRLLDLSEKDASGVLRLHGPSALLISGKKVSLSGLVMNGPAGEHLEVGAELALDPLEGDLDAKWADMDLSRADYWLSDVEVAGKSSGRIYAQWLRNVLHKISAKAEASGSLSVDGQKVRVGRVSVQVDRDEQKMLAAFDLGIDKTTTMRGHFSSLVKSGVLLPEEGTIDAELNGLDLSLFRRWVPEGLKVGGMVSGALRGRLLREKDLDIEGGVSISGGFIGHRSEKGEISVTLRKAGLKFAWNNSSLKGTVSLVFQDYGQAEGKFVIPLAATLPPSIEAGGPVNVSLNGQFQEEGLLTALFPGLVQETHGRIELRVEVGGVWKAPAFGGTMQLSKAGAYFPAGGVRIKDAGLTAHLKGDKVAIDSFEMSSGPGKIEGTAEVKLKGLSVAGYKATLRGKDFQVIYLPELRMEASPDISFEGSNEKLALKGEVRIPYLLVLQSKTKTPVEPSKDVIIIDRKTKPEEEMKTAIDMQLRVILGDRVIVKAEGIDAQMGGSIDLTSSGNIRDIRGRGEIHVVKGKYSAYGVSLDIERGRIIFTGQAVDKPSLDVLAIRKVEDVKAGVTVTGTPQNPTIKLYSDPSMADTDILAYIVLGHPLGGSQQQADLVARAAGVLLSASDSVVFQDQLKHRLGIDTLDIESTKTSQETAPGSGQEGVSRSLVTVGKYLTPSLYISYGRSLLGDTNLLRVRYSLSKHWELETEGGTESGADLFYKINIK